MLIWLAAIACLGVMFVFLLVGVAGPQAVVTEKTYAFNCNNNTRHAEAPCDAGVALTSGAVFRTEVDRVDPLYQYVALQVTPFALLGSWTPNQTMVTLNVTLYGSAGNEFHEMVQIWSRLVNNPVECDLDGAACTSFYLVDEPELFYTKYYLEAYIPGGSDATFLGDFLFQWEANDPDYMREQMGVRYALFIVSGFVLAWYALRLTQAGHRHWTMEQSWSLALAVLLVFWPVVFVLMEGVFLAAFLLYCLLYLDMIRSDQRYRVPWETPLPWLKVLFWGRFGKCVTHRPQKKVAAVFVYLVLSVALFMWEQVLFLNDPIVKPSTLAGPSALFYVVALCYALLICWLIVLLIFIAPRFSASVRAAPSIDTRRPAAPAERPAPRPSSGGGGDLSGPGEDSEAEHGPEWHEVTNQGAASSSRPVEEAAAAAPLTAADSSRVRLIHSCAPMMVVAGCTLVNVLAGSVGPFGSSAPSFMFFHTLYNATILFWICGYWPVGQSGGSGGGAGVSIVRQSANERQPLVSNPFAASERQADQSEDREVPLFK